MKRSEFYAARLAHWNRQRPHAASDLHALEDCEAAEAAGKTWDAEEEAPEPLPRRLHFCDAEAGDIPPRVVASDAPGTWVAVLPAHLPLFEKRKRALLAAVEAYNREREEEELDADENDSFAAGLSRIYREEVDEKVEAGVEIERARCLSILDWLLGSFPAGWDYARRMTQAAAEKVKSGALLHAREASIQRECVAAASFPSPAWTKSRSKEEPDRFTPEADGGGSAAEGADQAADDSRPEETP